MYRNIPILIEKINAFLGEDRFIGVGLLDTDQALESKPLDNGESVTPLVSDSADILPSFDKQKMLELELYYGLRLDAVVVAPDQFHLERRLIPFADLEALAAYTSGWRDPGNTVY
jgi:hypothetical protein